jgi:hypothetical protein
LALFLAQNSPQRLRGLLRNKVWKAAVLSARTKEAAKTPAKAIVQSKERRSTLGTSSITTTLEGHCAECLKT